MNNKPDMPDPEKIQADIEKIDAQMSELQSQADALQAQRENLIRTAQSERDALIASIEEWDEDVEVELPSLRVIETFTAKEAYCELAGILYQHRNLILNSLVPMVEDPEERFRIGQAMVVCEALAGRFLGGTDVDNCGGDHRKTPIYRSLVASICPNAGFKPVSTPLKKASKGSKKTTRKMIVQDTAASAAAKAQREADERRVTIDRLKSKETRARVEMHAKACERFEELAKDRGRVEAAEMTVREFTDKGHKISIRTLRRLVPRYRKLGIAGLVPQQQGRVGRPPKGGKKNPLDGWMTLAEIASALGVSKNTARRIADSRGWERRKACNRFEYLTKPTKH